MAREQRQPLPAPEPTPFDALLLKRVTCRNYDTTRTLGLAEFSAVLHRTFAARAVVETAPGVHVLKKGVPSAGGLHPTEAYLLVQRVEGIAPGLYHYHPIDHALEPIRMLEPDKAQALARTFVAGQDYFAEAHVMVIAASIAQGFSSQSYGSYSYGNNSGVDFGRAGEMGVGRGVGSAFDRIAKYYLDLADQVFPVVEIDAGQKVSFVMVKGESMGVLH